MPDHGQFTISLPAGPVYRRSNGTLTATPAVFINLYSLHLNEVVPHEVSFEVAQHIDATSFNAALDASGWCKLFFEPEQVHTVGGDASKVGDI